jgi:hypothetical protein
MTSYRQAPPLQTAAWMNVEEPLTLEGLRGRVVLLHAFQMRCRGCHELATPQAQRVHETFSRDDVAVLGLHCVFENNESESPELLRRYVSEQRLTFPLAIDAAGDGNGIPRTMKMLNLDGTPTLVLLDRHGRIRMKRLGYVPDLELGAAIGALVAESPPPPRIIPTAA